MYSRKEVAELAEAWLGKNEKDGSFKSIIDIYNSQKTLPRGIKMRYDWSWCACTWSALAIKLGYEKIMPIEISCGNLIELAKKMGIWVENDSYIPRIGDAVLYDWDDSGKGDNTGWPDHIGVVYSVDRDKAEFVVIEGNYSNAVKKRIMPINGRYIRGFITPKYDEENTTDKKKTVKEIAQEVIAGKWGTGEARKKALTKAGYDYDKVQAKVNKLLKK